MEVQIQNEINRNLRASAFVSGKLTNLLKDRLFAILVSEF